MKFIRFLVAPLEKRELQFGDSLFYFFTFVYYRKFGFHHGRCGGLVG